MNHSGFQSKSSHQTLVDPAAVYELVHSRTANKQINKQTRRNDSEKSCGGGQKVVVRVMPAAVLKEHFM